MWFSRYASGQTNDILIALLRTPPGSEVINIPGADRYMANSGVTIGRARRAVHAAQRCGGEICPKLFVYTADEP